MHMQHKLLGTLLLAIAASTASAAGPYEWTVSQLSRGKTALVLTDAAQPVTLKAGWACVVSSPDSTGGYEARTTTCRKNNEEFRFIVHCEPGQPKNETMIQFGKSQEADYIEIACAPRRVA